MVERDWGFREPVDSVRNISMKDTIKCADNDDQKITIGVVLVYNSKDMAIKCFGMESIVCKIYCGFDGK